MGRKPLAEPFTLWPRTKGRKEEAALRDFRRQLPRGGQASRDPLIIDRCWYGVVSSTHTKPARLNLEATDAKSGGQRKR